MISSKIKQTNIIYSSAEKHAVDRDNSFVKQGYHQMCPPSKRTGFVKVKESKRTSGGGGYAPMSHGVAVENVEDNTSDFNTGASSYNDFILYNYGKASERHTH